MVVRVDETEQLVCVGRGPFPDVVHELLAVNRVALVLVQGIEGESQSLQMVVYESKVHYSFSRLLCFQDDRLLIMTEQALYQKCLVLSASYLLGVTISLGLMLGRGYLLVTSHTHFVLLVLSRWRQYLDAHLIVSFLLLLGSLW